MNCPLKPGKVKDAQDFAKVISRNFDMSPNFNAKLLTSSHTVVTRSSLKEQLADLLGHHAGTAIFYFSGHGIVSDRGGFLVTQDASKYDEGVSMVDVLSMINQSPTRQVVVLLDCCHSGAFGIIPAISTEQAHLREGVSVLSASRSTEPAFEQDGHGVFTALILEALRGGASDLLGRTTVADLYAFVDRNLGPWDQRPLFKCHVSTLSPLRHSNPRIAISVLRKLPDLFPAPTYQYQLAPSYERTHSSAEEEHVEAFRCLAAYREVGLLRPSEDKDMYLVAISSGTCRLTKLGEYYWYLASEKLV